jgi:hypothetical protein
MLTIAARDGDIFTNSFRGTNVPTSITQRVQLDAPPAVVYEMLMASRRHAGFTGEPARISRREGGRFAAYVYPTRSPTCTAAVDSAGMDRLLLGPEEGGDP